MKNLLFLIIFNSALLVAQDSIQKERISVASLIPQIEQIVSAPVLLKNDTLFYIKSSADSYPVEIRAEEISKRLENLTKWYKIGKDTIYTKNIDDYINIMYNDDLAFIVTENDARIQRAPLEALAQMQLISFKKTLDKEETLSTIEWLKRIGYFIISFLVLYGLIRLINLLFRRLDKRLSKIEKKFLRKNRNIIKYFIPRSTANIFVFISKVVRIFLLVVLLIIYAPFMFSFFPWAEHIVHLFYGYIETPILFIFYGFVDFIPSLFFIIIIAYITRYVVRVLKDITLDVELGKFKIPNFHKDWAKPTEKIFLLFIYAFALVLIYPKLPGSGSTAFKGVSIFIGAIISFGSTSAIANIIAGIVITYMRPFQIGDRVKIDGIVGDIFDKTILVTHIRTPKNEDVTIPNANILMGNIINYSNNEDTSIILHTTITLGYNLPWQTAQKLLLLAADKTELVLKDPIPFVLQTSLDDYYVSYELNVSTNEAKKIPWIYSEVHKHILEVFNEAGIEILSPAYIAARDGNVTTVPSKLGPDVKSPINKLVDHLTGRNQKSTISKSDTSDNN